MLQNENMLKSRHMAFDAIKKALSNLTGKRYLGFLPGNLPVNTHLWGSEQFLNAHDISLYVNRALSKRAEKVSEIKFELRNRATDALIENAPVLDVLNKPNKHFSGPEFWELYEKYYDTVGEVFIWKEYGRKGVFNPKELLGLHILMPTNVEIEYTEDGEIAKYIYKRPTQKDLEYLPEEIIFIRRPDVKKPLRGQSLLKAGVMAIQTETQISAYHSRVLENGGKVEGVFTFKTDRLTEAQLHDIKAKYKKEYADARKAGIPLFLGGDSQYVKTGLTPDELSYLEAKKATLGDICILTGVPQSMLALTNDVKYDNADADRAIFLRETIKPLLVKLTTALDMSIIPDEQVLKFEDPTPENVDQKLKETETGIKNYYMTVNEARERHGLDPVPEGDVIMVPFSVLPLGEDRTPAPAPEDEEKDENGKRYKGSVHPNRDPDVRAGWGRMQVKRMDAREKMFDAKLKQYFSEQRERLIETLSADNTRSMKKTALEEALQISVEVKIGRDMFIPVLTNLLEQAGTDAMEFAGSSFRFHLGAEISSWIDKRADVFLNFINDTTFETLKQQFSDSIAGGETREQLITRVRDTYGNISSKRAKTIARTEVHNATQFGTMEGYKQAGLTTKIWVAVMDESTRMSHASVDGEERPFNTPFSNGLMYPGDPSGPAEETINCRCTI